MKKLFCIFALILLLSTCLTSCEVEPAPKIKEGRFNFSVTYEEWGEAKTVSGVFVCEYAGRSFTLEGETSQETGRVTLRALRICTTPFSLLYVWVRPMTAARSC